MPKLVKCEIANEKKTFFKCPKCEAHLKDIEETKRGAEKAVFLCPQCRCFFDENGIIPYDVADGMFPGASDYSY